MVAAFVKKRGIWYRYIILGIKLRNFLLILPEEYTILIKLVQKQMKERGLFMDPALLIELFGYLGSTLVVVSMLMASVVKLRVINTLGSVISATYALIIGSFPLALMNICLIVINVYNLFKLLKTEQQYDLVKTAPEDAFVGYFLERNLKDILNYFPDFDGKPQDMTDAYMVCCNGDPAGVLIGKDLGEGKMDVELDYSVPAYRDCSVGKFLYGKLPGQGVKTLTFARKASDTHLNYIAKMGFRQEKGVYTKELR